MSLLLFSSLQDFFSFTRFFLLYKIFSYRLYSLFCRRWASKSTQAVAAGSSSLDLTPSAQPSALTAFTRWQNKLAELKRRMLITLLCVVFYYYPSLLTTVLSLFSCYHIDPASPHANQLYPQNARVSILALQHWHKQYSSFV